MATPWSDAESLAACTFRHAFLRRFCNTVLRSPWIYELLTGKRFRYLDTAYWKGRRPDGKRGITDYIELSPTSLPLLDEVERRARGDRQAAILDLGCNVGRHVRALRDRGFANLHGVDVNPLCAGHMDAAFPGLATQCAFVWRPFQEYLPTVPTGFFDIVFTHGKTIEHVPPGFPLVRELGRVCKGCVVLGNVGFGTGSYPRFWIHEFERAGFALVKLLQPEREWSPDSPQNRPHSLAVFVRIPERP
jgi:SAM-dependent methyltransferase